VSGGGVRSLRTVQYSGAGLLVVLSQTHTHTTFQEGGEKGKAVSAGGVGPLVVRSVDGGRRSYLPVVVSPGGRAACGLLGSGLGFGGSHSRTRSLGPSVRVDT
jgi:hypothetical protein